jgi:hypothetical protein
MIGIVRAKGKHWIPFKAWLLYHPPNWEKPKRHSLAVLYLTTSRQVPVLGFHMNALQRVPDLDVEGLSDQLLKAGCIRVPAKDIPIQLPLPEKNDQATLDRLYRILQELMHAHGAS